MEILCVIPARGGSKGVKNKNIRIFNGLPLIAYAITEAKQIKAINRIVVSTDSLEIKKIAEKFGAEVPFLRPKKLARDTSSAIDAFEHMLITLKKEENYQPDYFVVILANTPLKKAKDIRGALKLFFSRKADSLASVVQAENLLLTKDKKTDRLKFLNPEALASLNRQQLPDVYRLDGCTINIVNTKIFLKTRSLYAGKFIGYEMDRWRAIDIDEPQDFVVGELIHKNYKRLAKRIKNFK